ncbi:hypothetical protein FGO68_gene2379 [Halteria grandinella]|uniref:Uncharacterized protein n=1 Tax=Halteria grandinella TaxID=5974 RepID=A0A8J8NSK7_HALGN|nr:hypothetical protein FGO68_gene2379 [Halteria grandinella]
MSQFGVVVEFQKTIIIIQSTNLGLNIYISKNNCFQYNIKFIKPFFKAFTEETYLQWAKSRSLRSRAAVNGAAHPTNSALGHATGPSLPERASGSISCQEDGLRARGLLQEAEMSFGPVKRRAPEGTSREEWQEIMRKDRFDRRQKSKRGPKVQGHTRVSVAVFSEACKKRDEPFSPVRFRNAPCEAGKEQS